jgi:hypothetical protein
VPFDLGIEGQEEFVLWLKGERVNVNLDEEAGKGYCD